MRMFLFLYEELQKIENGKSVPCCSAEKSSSFLIFPGLENLYLIILNLQADQTK